MGRPYVGETVTLMVTWTSRPDALRLISILLRAWPKIARRMLHGEGKRRRPILLAIRRDIVAWCGGHDNARVSRENCTDLADVCDAVEDAMPRAKWTQETLGHFADALSSGYWSAERSDTEEYEWTGRAWKMTRDRDEELSDEAEAA